MISLTSPVNSFVQFNHTDPVNDCIENEELCLQAASIQDILFQVLIPRSNSAVPPADDDDYKLYICKDCGQLFITEWNIDNLQDIQASGVLEYLVIIPSFGATSFTVSDSHEFTMQRIVDELNAYYHIDGFWSFTGTILKWNGVTEREVVLRLDLVDDITTTFHYNPVLINNTIGEGCGLKWQQSVDGTKFWGVPNAWNDNLNQLLTAGQCFKLCITGPTTYRATWDISNINVLDASTHTHWRFSFAGLSGVLSVTTSGPGGIVMNQLVGFFSMFWPGLGTWSHDGTTLVLDSAFSFVGAGDLKIENYDTPYMGEKSYYQEYDYPVTYAYVNKQLLGCSNCFIYTPDTCYSTRLYYKNNENSMGFEYKSAGGIEEFLNVVRLPFFLKNPHVLSEKTVYRKSDGTYVKLSAIMEKEYEVEVDWLKDSWHTKLAVALEHDTLAILNEASNTIEQYILDTDEKYEVDWSMNKRGTNYPLAPASFKLKQMPFANFNNNCCNE